MSHYLAEANAPVPENIRRIVNKRGLKLKAVAAEAGYIPQRMADMLGGRKIIKPADVIALAAALKVPPGELFKPTESEE